MYDRDIAICLGSSHDIIISFTRIVFAAKPKLIKFMTKKEAPAPRPSIRKGVIRVYGEPRHEGEMYRTIAVTLEDQVQNILPIALKKFGIMEPWQDYTLSVRFRTAGSSIFSSSSSFKRFFLTLLIFVVITIGQSGACAMTSARWLS